MNSLEIVEKFKKYIQHQSSIVDCKIDHLTAKTQESKSTSILFYNLTSDATSEEKFFQRMNGVPVGLLVLNKKIKTDRPFIVIEKSDFNIVQKELLNIFSPIAKCPKLVAITGTNGKTTTAVLAVQIAKLFGKGAMSLGTMGLQDHDQNIIKDFESTTPTLIEFHQLIFDIQNKVEVLFFEYSSHAIEQKRIGDWPIAVAAWTSFSQDHLDYHKTMDAYFEAKRLILDELKNDSALFVPSTQLALFDKLKKTPLVKMCKNFDEIIKSGSSLFFRPLYNQENFCLAYALNHFLWDRDVEIDLNKIKTPKGRLDFVKLKNTQVVIDFAHSPEGIQKVGNTLKDIAPELNQVWVFGCGGNRDKLKRPLMYREALRFAHKIILTSDNPRFEEPQNILDDMVSDSEMPNQVEKIADRKLAIKKAIELATKDDIVIIAGKGHEPYQEIKGIKYPYSDYEEIKKEM